MVSGRSLQTPWILSNFILWSMGRGRGPTVNGHITLVTSPQKDHGQLGGLVYGSQEEVRSPYIYQLSATVRLQGLDEPLGEAGTINSVKPMNQSIPSPRNTAYL